MNAGFTTVSFKSLFLLHERSFLPWKKITSLFLLHRTAIHLNIKNTIIKNYHFLKWKNKVYRVLLWLWVSYLKIKSDKPDLYFFCLSCFKGNSQLKIFMYLQNSTNLKHKTLKTEVIFTVLFSKYKVSSCGQV